MIEDADKIKDAIEVMHHCTARHVASSRMHESFEGRIAWQGVVETYELTGHPKAKRCHAWCYDEKGETQYVTALELPPVDSPESAVKVATAAEASKK